MALLSKRPIVFIGNVQFWLTLWQFCPLDGVFFRETWAKRAKRAFQGERSEPWEPLQPILLVHSFPTALKKRKSLHKHQRNEPSKFRSSEASETSKASKTNKTRFIRRAKRAFKKRSSSNQFSNNCQATIAIIFPSSFIIFKVGPDTVAPVVSGKQGRQVKKADGKRQQFQLFSLA